MVVDIDLRIGTFQYQGYLPPEPIEWEEEEEDFLIVVTRKKKKIPVKPYK